MWTANFLVSASVTMIIPFLSLFIGTMGDFSDEYVQLWAGNIFGITFLTAFIISPIWGRFADKHGYKKILLMTSFGIATSILLMGFVTSVTQLFVLRLFMGIVTGFIPTSMAFISRQTPKESAGKILGTIQTGAVTGGLLGPLIGGVLADTVGFQYTFILTSIIIGFAHLLVLFGLKEIQSTDSSRKRKEYSRREVLILIYKHPLLLKIMLVTLLMQMANLSIQPLLALYVSQLHGPSNLALLAGIAFSATGFGNLLAARSWGNLGDRIGHEKVVVFLLIFSALLFIPQALAETYWQLVFFRFLFGIALGGLIPCITAYIRNTAPVNIQGEVLGYNVSFRFLGNVLGPIMGGLLSGVIGISSMFFVTSALFCLSALLLWFSTYREQKSNHRQVDL